MYRTERGLEKVPKLRKHFVDDSTGERATPLFDERGQVVIKVERIDTSESLWTKLRVLGSGVSDGDLRVGISVVYDGLD